MKVIDLLNKIANGEEVPLIKYRDKISHWNKENDRFEDKDGMNTLYEVDFSELNDEVELIEEDKKIPEKSILDVDSDASGSYDTVIINGAEYQISRVERYMIGKINEIIDYINGGTND